MSNITITSCELQRYRGSSESGYDSEIQVIQLGTDSGAIGLGFATATAATGENLALLISNVLGPALIGREPWLNNELWRELHRDLLPRRGGEGLARVALSALDFALWDLKGKLANVPVAKLLGGYRELIPTYANCAHHLPPDELAERAAQYVANGHKALKIRGTRSYVTLDEATERVRQVRAAIGEDIRLMVDVNGSWDVDTAIAQLRRWEPYQLYWLEEPVAPEDFAGYRRIRARAGQVNIAGGEQHVGLAEFKTLIENDCVDIVQPNAAVTGGISDWLQIHAFASAHSVPVSPWNLQPIHLHLAAGLENVQWLEYFMADNALLKFQTELFTGPRLDEVRTDEGVFLRAPTEPGLGLALDPDIAERSRVG